jgi:hypothetical protein
MFQTTPTHSGHLALRQMYIVYAAQLFGLVLFNLVAVMLHTFHVITPVENLRMTMLVVTAAVALGALLTGGAVFRAKIAGVRGVSADATGADTARERVWFTASLVRMALYESAAMINAVAMLLTGWMVFAMMFILLLGLFITLRPTEERFRKEITGME